MAPARCAGASTQNRMWQTLPHPVSTPKAKSPSRRLRPGDDLAIAQVPCARHGDRGPLMRARFRWSPPQCTGLVRLRPDLLRQVAQKRAVHDAGGSSPVCHEGRFTDTRARPCLWNFHHASCTGPQAAAGAFPPCRWDVGLAASGHKPVKPSRGDVESAMSPFGSGRPVRPWSVVNPGEGTAAP